MAAVRLASHLVGRRFRTALDGMQAAQHLPADVLLERSAAKLTPLLRHAVANVPFYRDYLHRVRGGEDLRSFPVVGKAVYREHGLNSFLAKNLPEHRRLEWTTSGSTGEPFRFYHDREALPYVYASHLFYDTSFGLSSFDRYVRIMTPPVTAPPLPPDAPLQARLRQGARTQLQKWYERLTQERISLWELGPERAQEIYSRIQRFRPDYILGYTSSLATAADLLMRRNLHLQRRLKAVVTIAETLTPERRRLIEDYFQAPICNRWGQREFKFWSAQSCPGRPERFHINTELVVAEVLDGNDEPVRPGQMGRLVMTNLTNYVMPFIRYDTGDLAVLGDRPCECGSGFPLITHLEGRSQECFETANGAVIHPVVLGQYLFVTHNFVDAIRHFQLIQQGPGKARFLVVPGERWNSQAQCRLVQTLGHLFGGDTDLRVEVVGEIAAESSGKRPIIKKVMA